MRFLLPLTGLAAGFQLGIGVPVTSEFFLLIAGISLVYWAINLPQLLGRPAGKDTGGVPAFGPRLISHARESRE